MKFKVIKTSEFGCPEDSKVEVKFTTMKEFAEWTKQFETDEFVINFKEGFIEIYDDYRE